MAHLPKVRIATGEVFEVTHFNETNNKVGIIVTSRNGKEYYLEITEGFYEFIN